METPNNINNDELNEEYKKLSAFFLSIWKKNMKVDINIILKLLSKFNKINRSPSYAIHSEKVINEVEDTASMVFSITEFPDLSWEHSKINTENLFDYNKLIKIEKQGDEFYLNMKKINIFSINKNNLKRQLPSSIQFKILSHWLKYWVKNINSIVDEYISFCKKNYWSKNWSETFRTLIAWPDWFKQEHIKSFSLWKNLNKEFILKLDSFFENNQKINKLKSFIHYWEDYSNLIKSYKEELWKEIDRLSKLISKLLALKTRVLKEESDLKKAKEDRKILEEKIEKIDLLLDEEWVESFFNEIKSIYLEKYKKVNFFLNKYQDIESKRQEIKKLDIIKSSIESKKQELKDLQNNFIYYSNEENIYSKNVEKGDTIFWIIFKTDDIRLYDTNWDRIKWKIRELINLFNLKELSDDFDFKYWSNWILIKAKKSWILLDSFVNWKLNFQIDSEFIDSYSLSLDISDEKNIEEELNLRSYNYENWRNTSWDISYKEEIRGDEKWIKSEILVWDNFKIDNLTWVGVFWKDISIWRVKPIETKTQDSFIKPIIYWNSLDILKLESDTTINLISEEYLNLSLLLEKEFNKKTEIFSEDINSDLKDYLMDFDFQKNIFLNPQKIVSLVSKKIEVQENKISAFNNKKKSLVNLYVELFNSFKENNQEEVFLELEERFSKEIKKVNDNWELFNSYDDILNFINLDLLNIDEVQASKTNLIKLKKFFNLLWELFFSAISLRKLIKSNENIKKYLDKIKTLNWNIRLSINWNISDESYIKLDYLSLANYWARFNEAGIKLTENWSFKIPKWTWINLSINNWKVDYNVDFKLEDIINEKIESLDRKYYASLSVDQVNKLKWSDKNMYLEHINNIKKYIYDLLSSSIHTERWMTSFKNKSIENIFNKRVLLEITKKRDDFEIKHWFKKSKLSKLVKSINMFSF